MISFFSRPMEQIEFSVSLLSKFGKPLKKPKKKSISCFTDWTLCDLHKKILILYQLGDMHIFAFYLKGEPYKLLDFEWGGEGDLFSNPAELIFRSVFHKALEQASTNPSNDVTDYITEYLDSLMKSQSHSVDLLPMKQASEKSLKDCNFKVNDSFFYVYDFGDSYIFSLDVVSISKVPNTPSNKKNFRESHHETDTTDFDGFIDSLREMLDESEDIPEIENSQKARTSKRKSQQLSSFSISNDNSKQSLTKKKNMTLNKSKKKVNTKLKISKQNYVTLKNSYDEILEELLNNLSDSYPDKFIDAMISINNDGFSIELLREFNYGLRDLSPEFLTRSFFSSTKSFEQLCSLFINHIQLDARYSDNLFVSFLEFGCIQFNKNNSVIQEIFKKVLLTTLLLCLDCFDENSIEKFLIHCDGLLTLNDFVEIGEFWDKANRLNNIRNIIQSYLGIESNKSEEIIYFTRALIYSKPIQKTLLYAIFRVFPEIIKPVIKFVLDPTIEENLSVKDWILPIIELIGEHVQQYDYTDIIEDISLHTNFGDAVSKFIVGCTCWMITGNLSYIRDLKGLNATRVKTKISKVLSDPEAFRNKILINPDKFWLKISELENTFYSNNQKDKSSNDPNAIYIIEITLKGRKISRLIAINGDSSLDDLHEYIQDLFEFDNDHLYGFFLNNVPYSHVDSYYSPYDEQENHADKKLIYLCNFFIGMKFLYIFDFGDDWRFQLQVKDIRNKMLDEDSFPYLISQRGKPPEQYPDDDMEFE